MCQRTHDRLRQQHQELSNQYDATIKARGEAGAGGDWHDNATLDHLDEQANLISSRLATIYRQISTAEIIHPPSSVDKVIIGAEVEVEFGVGDRESLLILGPADNDPDKGIISFETPLARAIMNKRPGDTASFTVGEGRNSNETRIKVVRVRPGKF